MSCRISPDQHMRDTMATDDPHYMKMLHPNVPLWNVDGVSVYVTCRRPAHWDNSWAMFEAEVKMPALVAAAG